MSGTATAVKKVTTGRPSTSTTRKRVSSAKTNAAKGWRIAVKEEDRPLKAATEEVKIQIFNEVLSATENYNTNKMAYCEAWLKAYKTLNTTQYDILLKQMDMSEATTCKMRSIARCEIFKDLKYARFLPWQSWTSMYTLSLHPELIKKHANDRGKIHPGMTGEQIANIVPVKDKKKDKASVTYNTPLLSLIKDTDQVNPEDQKAIQKLNKASVTQHKIIESMHNPSLKESAKTAVTQQIVAPEASQNEINELMTAAVHDGNTVEVDLGGGRNKSLELGEVVQRGRFDAHILTQQLHLRQLILIAMHTVGLTGCHGKFVVTKRN